MQIKEKLGFTKLQKTKKKSVKPDVKKIQKTVSEEIEVEKPVEKVTFADLKKTIVTRKELEKWCKFFILNGEFRPCTIF